MIYYMVNMYATGIMVMYTFVESMNVVNVLEFGEASVKLAK